MTMPIQLTLVRHGESEGNVAVKASENGDNRHFTPEFVARHSSNWRLTDKGIQQAEAAGEFIRNYIGEYFDLQYMSHYLRAQETALNLGLSNTQWREDIFLREREWGEFDRLPIDQREVVSSWGAQEKKIDSFYWIPPNGRSIAEVVERVKNQIITTLAREGADKRVIIVCHGEVMWALLFLLTNMTVAHYHRLEASRDPLDRIRNCQIIQFDRRDETQRLHRHYTRFRSVCPWDITERSLVFREVPRGPGTRRNVSIEDIKLLLDNHPRMINDSTPT